MEEEEDGAFDSSAVKAIVAKVCNNCLANQAFAHAKVQTWVSTIVENVLKELAVANDEAAKSQGQKFKYVVTAIMQQNVGAALQGANSMYWDRTTDGFCSVKWENEGIQMQVQVYGAAC